MEAAQHEMADQSDHAQAVITDSTISLVKCSVFYMDPASIPAKFVGQKEKYRLPLKQSHTSYAAFVKHVMSHLELHKEAKSKGLGDSIDVRLCRLEKGGQGTQAFTIANQEQWDVERQEIIKGDMLQGKFQCPGFNEIFKDS